MDGSNRVVEPDHRRQRRSASSPTRPSRRRPTRPSNGVGFDNSPIDAALTHDRYRSLGFEIIAVGKAPSSLAHYNRYATPDSVAEDAKRVGINPHFLVTFRDGTKTMIEMACISNYTRLVPDVPGMHGPVAGVDDMPRLFRPKSGGGILNRRGVVDYARPINTQSGKIDFYRSVTPGVFLVVYIDHPQIRADLDYLDVTGSDGYYNMYTPYHLVTSEMPLAIVTAVLNRHPTVYARYGLVTEVIGVAKRDLKAGEIVDGLGGAMLYSSNDLYEPARDKNQVPMCLLSAAWRPRAPQHRERPEHHLRHGRAEDRHQAVPVAPAPGSGRCSRPLGRPARRRPEAGPAAGHGRPVNGPLGAVEVFPSRNQGDTPADFQR